MLWIATLLASAQPIPGATAPAVAPRVQAKATARIMRAASLRVGDTQTLEGAPLRSTRVRSSEGELVPAMLAEFE